MNFIQMQLIVEIIIKYIILMSDVGGILYLDFAMTRSRTPTNIPDQDDHASFLSLCATPVECSVLTQPLLELLII